MPSLKIARKTVASLPRVEKPTTYWDTDLKGFGVAVRPSGSKSFVVEYRPNGGGRSVAKRRLVIGPVDDAMPADIARTEAKLILAKVRMGEDPVGDRNAVRAASSLNDMLDAYLKQHIEPKRKASTADLYRSLIDSHVRPTLGKKKATQITRSDVAKLLVDISEKRDEPRKINAKRRASKSKAKGGRAVANRTISILAAAYTWAGGMGMVDETFNPCKRIERFKEQGRERFLTTEELAKLGAALHEADSIGLPFDIDDTRPTAKHAPKAENRRTMMPIQVTGALRVILFTGARLREILNLEWKHVDLERGALFLPDSKTGRKTVFLSTAAQEIIAEMPRLGRYVFCGDSAGEKNEIPRRDLKRPWRAVTKRAGLDGLRIHDLRHTFASFGAGGGLGLQTVGKLLGHTTTRMTEKYAHLANDPVRRAADQIGNALASAMNAV